MGEYRSFQVTLISASNLQDVRNFGEMKVYAKVSMSKNSSNSEWTTPVDKENQTNPRWNCKIQYLIPEETVHPKGTFGTLKLSYSFGTSAMNIIAPGHGQSSTTRGPGKGRRERFAILLGAIADGMPIWNFLYSGAKELYHMVFGDGENS
ncbi:hypothetical protein ACH5RR_027039 [Cinchona calisaya]|uniref:C2 domain-containing protein n=1 Tax=Cinchona calisaya TaxID=153742 RepID=A0ABD2Z882_9GENT